MKPSNSASHLSFQNPDRFHALNTSEDRGKREYSASPLRDIKGGIMGGSHKSLFPRNHLSSTSTLQSRRYDIHSASSTSLHDSNSDHSLQIVWAWGANQEGQLSLGVKENALLPHPIRINKAAGGSQTQIKMVSCSRQFTSSVTTDGRCLMVGKNLVGRLGIEGLTLTNLTRFRPIQMFSSPEMRVKQVACGEFHTLALLESGLVYSWGGTLHGKLGREYEKAPRIVDGLDHVFITKVACGDCHSLALEQSGVLFSWGGGEGSHAHGQCGHGSYDEVKGPRPIRYLEGKQIVEISAGKEHTLVLTSSNEVWGFGNGQHGQCGFGDNCDTPIPKLLTFPRNEIYMSNQVINNPNKDELPQIIGLAGGGRHSLIYSDRGLVYTFGLGSYGQLGHRNSQNYIKPKLVRDLTRKRIVDAAVGWHHSVVVDQQGNVYACGTNSNGQLGVGDTEARTGFTFVNKLVGRNVSRVYAGGNHTWAILDAIQPFKSQFEPPSPPGVAQSLTHMGSRSPDHFRARKTPSPDRLTPSGSQNRLKEPSRVQNFGQSSNVEIYNNPNVLPNKLPQFSLYIIYTKDIGMCHRFVRFEIKERDFKKMEISINKYISDLRTEGGYMYHRLNPDQDIFDEERRLAVSGNESRGDGKLSFTCLYIFDPMKADRAIEPLRPELLEESKEVEKRFEFTGLSGTTPVGKLVCLKESDIQRNEYEMRLSNWIKSFQRMTGNLCTSRPKFFQLRPNAYYPEI